MPAAGRSQLWRAATVLGGVRRSLLLAIMLLLGLPSAALAGTAYVHETMNRAGGREAALIFSAHPGERNDIVVGRSGEFNELTLRDAGAAVTAGAGCTAIDAHAVRCLQQPYVLNGVTLQLLRTAVIDAGDGDDAVRALSITDVALGGEGADALSGSGTLSGGPGDDVLTSTSPPPPPCNKACGSPPDVLLGGPGNDILRGGAASDLLSGDGIAPDRPDPGGGNDTIVGGGGHDIVSYAGRSTPVRVDLSGATGSGSPGEGDLITGVEQVTGGDGDDVLLGNDSDNTLTGGAGNDSLQGRGGDDDLQGQLGADRLRGNDGDDTIDGGQAGDALYGGSGDDLLWNTSGDSLLHARTVHCGSGRDSVARPQGQLLTACETADTGELTVSVRPRRTPSGRLRFDWRCKGGVRCEFTLTVRRRAIDLHRRRVSIAPGRRSLAVRPARPLRRGDVIAVAVTGRLVVKDGSSTLPTIGAVAFDGRWRARL